VALRPVQYPESFALPRRDVADAKDDVRGIWYCGCHGSTQTSAAIVFITAQHFAIGARNSNRISDATWTSAFATHELSVENRMQLGVV
jgi:hypothetical protein